MAILYIIIFADRKFFCGYCLA